MRRWFEAAAALALVAFIGCTDSDPTAVGDGLLPENLLRTYEVVLGPSRYLVADSSFAGYAEPSNVSFTAVANGFQGAYEAHTLARLTPPRKINVRNAAGVIVTDSMSRFVDGTLVVRVDTLHISPLLPLTLEVSRIEEAWDPASVTWTLRVDTGAVQLPWSQPGGTRSAPVGSGEWDLEGDSVLIPIDSMTLRLWSDTSNLARGALIRSATPDRRLRIVGVSLRSNHASSLADTTVTTTVTPPFPTFIIDPAPPQESSEPRVGGLPAYRAFFRLRERLDTVRVPCPPGSAAGCTVALGDMDINLAALILQPLPSPDGFVPEDSVGFAAIPVLVSNEVPLSRAPIAPGNPSVSRLYGPTRFQSQFAEPIELLITGFFGLLASDSTTSATLPPYLTVLSQTEGRDLGFVRFAERPSLRLVITTAGVVGLR